MTGRDVALIGAGRFGRFLALALVKAGYRVVVADRRRVRIPGAPRVTLIEAASRPVVFLALPAGEIRPVVSRLAPRLSPGTLVVNLAAVQELPAGWMRAALPRSVDCAGVHMLFGPDSARTGLRGHRAVLCPVRLSDASVRRLKSSLRKLGLEVAIATPRAHDHAMARTLFLTQFTGRALAGMLAPAGFRTRNAELLSAIIDASTADSPALFHDLYRYNPYTRGLPEEIIARCRLLAARLKRA
jgi:prephenate dehydrogenase